MENSTKYILSLLLLVLIGVVGYALIKGNGQTAGVNNNRVVMVTPTPTPLPESKIIEVKGGPFYFTPSEITVNEGDRIRIIFINEEGTHDWVLDEFNARTSVINIGETAETEFIADKTGTFEYYCSVGNHRQMGMVGKLTVNSI